MAVRVVNLGTGKRCCMRRRRAAVPVTPCTNPEFISINPVADDTVADVTEIVWTFDRPVIAVSLVVYEVNSDVPCASATQGAGVDGDANSVGDTVVFNNFDPLTPGQRYQSTLTVSDVDDPTCTTTVQACFTNAAPCTEPVQLSVVPASGATASPANIVWTFDVPVTIVSILVELTSGGAGVPCADRLGTEKVGTSGVVGAVVTFTPTTGFGSTGAIYRHTLTVAKVSDPTCQATVQACFTTIAA